MLAKVGFFLCLICFSYCSYIDTIESCELVNDVVDETCAKNGLARLISDASASGIAELGIPALDPLSIKEMSVPILNVLDFTLYDGVVKGFKNCAINKNRINMKSKHGLLDITCSLTIKGRYRAKSNSETFTALFGGESIHGDGRGRVRIEQLNIRTEFNFDLVSRDGEIYIVDRGDKIKAKYDVLGKMTFAADNLYVGDVESSKMITDFLNQNWRDLFNSFGSVVMDRAMEVVRNTINDVYNKVPARYIVKNDLTPYLSS